MSQVCVIEPSHSNCNSPVKFLRAIFQSSFRPLPRDSDSRVARTDAVRSWRQVSAL